MTFHRIPVVFCCLVFLSSSAVGQSLSVADYLEAPTKTNAREIARKSPNVLKELIESFESADEDSVQLACMTAINASVNQTEQSRVFLRTLADSKELPDHLVTAAKFGSSINRLLAKEEGAKEEFVDLVDHRFWIGDRYDELMVEFSSERSPDVLLPLVWLVANNTSQSEVEDFANHALDQYFQKLSAAKDDCTLDESIDIRETIGIVLIAANLKTDGLFRKWLTKTLGRSDPLPHLGATNSRGIAVIRGCLKHLKTHEILKSDFVKLKTLVPKKIFETGRDQDDVAIRFASDIVEIVNSQPETTDYRNRDNPLLVLNYADQLACEILPSFLAIDLADCRNAETQVLARQAMSEVLGRDPAAARKVYVGLADQLIKSGEDEKIAVALDLLSSFEPVASDRRFVERMAYGAVPSRTPFIKAKATALLAIWDQKESAPSSSNSAFKSILSANRKSLDFEQQADLARDLAKVDRGAGLRMIIQLIETAKTFEDKYRMIQYAADELESHDDNRRRLSKVELSQIYPVARIVFEQLGATKENYDNEVTISLAKALVFEHPDGQRVIERFLRGSNNKTARNIAGSLLWEHLNKDFASAAIGLNNFYASNHDLDVYNQGEMNWHMYLEMIVQICLDTKGGAPVIQQENFRLILESHVLLLEKLKTIAGDKEHELQNWAKETLGQLEK